MVFITVRSIENQPNDQSHGYLENLNLINVISLLGICIDQKKFQYFANEVRGCRKTFWISLADFVR